MEFQSLQIIDPILRALEKKGYVEPTPIQAKTIPLLLDNKDVIGIAQTGTGKTAAFVVPILQKLHEKTGRATTPKALVLAPTRELAVQISESFKAYGTFLGLKQSTVYGGVGLFPQIRELQRGVDILIATPGRLLDLMNQKKVNLDKVEFFVLDEADRMLDMGFLRDIKKIASELPKEKQSLFFSATMSNEITILTKKFLKDPVRMEVTPQSTPVEKIDQSVFFIDPENKIELLLDLIKEQQINCSLIFVKTKHKADKISRILNQNYITTDSIHGNKSQSQRIKALNNFKAGKVKALVATDIAARGIDVNNISHVINFDLPNEPENYVHRIGRTARAGTNGTAYSFCSAEERNFLVQIERITKTKTEQAEHKYHSKKAKNATGNQAKPKPRGQYNNHNRNPRFNNNNNPRRNDSRSNSRFGSKDNSSKNRDNRNSNNPSSRNNSRSRFTSKKFGQKKFNSNRFRSRSNSSTSGSSRVRMGRTNSRR
jgi:ATP-dependent RNA helicase RhlE